ncbi:Syf2p [Lachancea thermotolerans CBS 6340]|uniref:Pre-mRNA-splicing factor SYF2 n=1 Tax=Lachancea thermotolerans (strain ATCC 56472 / CBS 6340 / NRRL Y-8284) TaxID=559295 RepID=C5DJA2_LACTC|nr:KLTH0F14784p [Lachancea thermotolerans CBS 6340]CAR24391.1 KLTH0F14784p [Lachancea thermotolerans CBS 6340]
MDLNKYADRLKNLKRKGVSLSVKNKQQILQEEKQTSARAKPAVYSMKTEEAPSSETTEESKEAKLLQYSMKDFEQWQDKERRKSQKSSDVAKYQDLAKFTYDKEVQQLRKNYTNKVEKPKKVSINKKGKIVVKDDPHLVGSLADSLNKTANERYARIEKKIHRQMVSDTPGGFINEKNKQFNDKIERQTKKREEN